MSAMSSIDAAELARRLSRQSLAVCRHYLPHGHRQGNYWVVGDVSGKPGRSLFVRLSGPDYGPGAAGKWTDAALAEHGDLLDLIAANRRLDRWSELQAEVLHFLGLGADRRTSGSRQPLPDLKAAARRLWNASGPIAGTTAETWLHHRGIDIVPGPETLRFHPNCRYRDDSRKDGRPVWTSWPAMIAAIRDNSGRLTGVHRTWLSSCGTAKAPVAKPRRAMGHMRRCGVRFGPTDRFATDAAMAVGEGIETVLSLREAVPQLKVAATLSAGNLAAFEVPDNLRRLYVLRDDDDAGRRAASLLTARAASRGIETSVIDPTILGLPGDNKSGADLNDALRLLGRERMRRTLAGIFDSETYGSDPPI